MADSRAGHAIPMCRMICIYIYIYIYICMINIYKHAYVTYICSGRPGVRGNGRLECGASDTYVKHSYE